MPVRLVSIVVLCSILVCACGGSGDDGDRAKAPTSTTQTTPRDEELRDALGFPDDVPLRASGAADPAQAKVIRDWTDALRGGDVAGASALWALPSTVQNVTPALKLRSRADVRAFNRSLPCGAVVTTSAGAAHGFTIITVRLTKRRGADCGTGAGGVARTAIRVRDGKIAEWYRLPDDPDGPAPSPDTTAGPTTES
jgi:hypothetical protein